ncbi:MAG TPA: BMC domain-containing protein [Halanaerobiales bacterium]|nr:BMC domain-containing protein [Halanaerobiales bacterium]
MSGRALGMIETKGLVGCVEAVDVMAKTADVEVIGCEKIGSGLVTVMIRGDVGSVKAAVEAAAQAVEKVGEMVGYDIIPRPDNGVEDILPHKANGGKKG